MRSAAAGSISAPRVSNCPAWPPTSAFEGAVDHAAGKQAYLHFVEPHAELALRHHAVVAVNGEHRASRRDSAP
jgi:hypothetical protein